MAILEGNEVWSTGPKRTQVYLATHDGEGNRLPFMNRSFISFSYGGKPIEDFNLIATFNDRLEKNVYADFEDSTSNYKTLDGQYFWGTHFQANQLNFTLSTDGMTQQELDSFKKYFMPGVEKELILAEHPNRAILARVSAAPSVSLLPFEEKITVFDMQISTTLYKGNINLSFVMDEPFWYSKMNYIPSYVDKDTLEPLVGEPNYENGQIVSITPPENSIYTLSDKDYLKIYLEDGIPFEQLLGIDNLFIGNDTLVKSRGALVEGAWVDQSYLELSYETKTELTVSNAVFQYLFYSGNAPAKPIIQFDMAPVIAGTVVENYEDISESQGFAYDMGTLYQNVNDNEDVSYQLVNGILESDDEQVVIDSNGKLYKKTIINDNNLPFIINPINSIGTANFDLYSNEYSYVKIVSPAEEEDYFYFTTPGIWTGYNKAIELINNCQNNESLLELKEHLRDEIKEYYSRAWALKSIEEILKTNEEMNDIIRNTLFSKMQQFLPSEDSVLKAATFVFDSATGEATGHFHCMDANTGAEIIVEENVGDMVKSSYLIIREKSNFNAVNRIDFNTCYKITSNETLQNFKILYKNMYL